MSTCLQTGHILKFPTSQKKHCQKYLLIVPIPLAADLFPKHVFTVREEIVRNGFCFKLLFILKNKNYGEPGNGPKQSVNTVRKGGEMHKTEKSVAIKPRSHIYIHIYSVSMSSIHVLLSDLSHLEPSGASQKKKTFCSRS